MKQITALALTVLLFALPARSEIREIKSFTDPGVKAELATEKQTTWIILDIDNTLIHPDSMIGSHQWGDYMRDQRIAMGSPMADAQAFQQNVFNSVQGIVPILTTENAVYEIINGLKINREPVFALTARKNEIRPQTLVQLSQAGFGFKDDEVLFSGPTQKGILLKQMIAASSQKPTKIIFFDDKRYNLDSVEKELQTMNIKFVGYRYGFLDAEVAGFRPDLANVEWVEFKRTGHIPTNAEAANLIFSR